LATGPGRLKDRGALRVQLEVLAPQRGRGVEIGQGRLEPVEDPPHPGARHEGPGVGRHPVDELVGQRRGPLRIGSAAQHLAPQGDPLDQLAALADGEPFFRRS
jgi:hypothetical protein